jgi:BASS family bile acid:Na+ symporter
MDRLRPFTALLSFVRRNLLWFLIASYALAAIWPGPGDRVRGATLGELPFTSGEFNPTHLLLGVLLFCVGVSIRPEESRQMWRLSRTVVWGVAAAWLVPLLGLAILLGLGACGIGGRGWLAFVTGALVVVAMPPANSASVWSELSGGQAAAAVSIIILGTLLSPLLTPVLLGLSTGVGGDLNGLTPNAAAASLEILVAFVVLPTALGIGVRSLCDALSERWQSTLLTASRAVALAALLMLNYANAAVAAPALMADSSLSPTIIVSSLTVLLCGIVFGLAIGVSRWIGDGDAGRRVGFVYVTAMKNTGAALVLATTFLAHQPLAVLVPVVYTVAQHLAAALTDRLLSLSRAPAGAALTPLRQSSTPSY